MNPDFFNITFDRVGFTFKQNPMGARVRIEWQDQALIGKVWRTSYSPERGYYFIGVRRELASIEGRTSTSLPDLSGGNLERNPSEGEYIQEARRAALPASPAQNLSAIRDLQDKLGAEAAGLVWALKQLERYLK